MGTAHDVAVAFKTLGCKVNQVESEDIAAELLGRGAVVVPEAEAAVVVINTCTVTGEADAKARKAVRHAVGMAGEPIVVVTGCLAALDPDALRALSERVVVESDKAEVAARVAELLELPDGGRNGADVVNQAAATGDRGAATPERVGEGFHTRVQLKIEDGCDAFCTYCIVPYARGVPRATLLADVVGEAQRLVDAGAREIVLTGINVGRYRDDDATLATVIERVAATGIARLRLSSVEPLDLTPELLGVMASTPAFCEHLHVPLQAGDDRVLSAMARGYDTAEFAARIADARAALPGVAITTDVLAGFPGETAEEAANTLAFCERIGFDRLHVFRYSARPGTPAADMPDQVDPRDRASRAAALRAYDSDARRAHAQRRTGDRAEALVERVVDTDDGPMAEGTTRDYLRVRVPADGLVAGDLVSVTLGGYADGIVSAALEGGPNGAS